jgi:putative peptide zinc metalloprotease protein
MFFKALGVALFVVEIAWFVVRPVAQELRAWWGLRARIAQGMRALVTLAGAAALVAAAFVPLDTHVHVPAVLGATQEAALHASEPARIERVRVAPGERVARGQLLYELASPAAEQDRLETRIRLARVKARLARAHADRTDRAQWQALQREQQAEQERLAGLDARLALLEVRAPFDGELVDVDGPLREGQWVAPSRRLGRVVDTAGAVDLRGYVAADEAWRLASGAPGRFVADDPRRAALPVRLHHAAEVAAESIELPYLASTYGGDVPSRVDARGRLLPLGGHYLLRLEPDAAATAQARRAGHVVRGVVALEAKGESLVERSVRHVLRVFARESGW